MQCYSLGEAPANAFRCILSSKISPGGNSYFCKHPKKKQLYRQVSERHSGVQKSSRTSFRRVPAQFSYLPLIMGKSRVSSRGTLMACGVHLHHSQSHSHRNKNLENELSEGGEVVSEVSRQKPSLQLHHSHDLLVSSFHLVDADRHGHHTADRLLDHVVSAGRRVVVLADVLTASDVGHKYTHQVVRSDVNKDFTSHFFLLFFFFFFL